MKLSIVIPAYNEGRSIAQVLERVLKADSGGSDKEIIMIDDGSRDDTYAAAQFYVSSLPEADQKKFRLLRHEKNQGKGAGVQTGFEAMTGDFVIIQDADLEYNPDDYKILLAAMENWPGAVFGWRGKNNFSSGRWHFAIGTTLTTLFLDLLFGVFLKDHNTGFKLMRAKDAKNMKITCRRFEIESEITANLIKRGIKIKEVPINYLPRDRSQGKHIGLKDFFAINWMTLKMRFRK